jgi:hypothetical protein
MKMQNGNIYKGSFADDKIHGEGILMIAATGTIFQGKIKKGICVSVGKLLYPNGDLYFGQHRAFVKEG